MIDFVLTMLSGSFEYVYILLNTVKIDSVSLWSINLAFLFGAVILRVLMHEFNPSSAGASAADLPDKYKRYRTKKSNQSNNSK